MARATDDDIENYSSKQLKELLPRIDALIDEKRKAEQQAVKDQLAARASEAGFSIDELRRAPEAEVYAVRRHGERQVS